MSEAEAMQNVNGLVDRYVAVVQFLHGFNGSAPAVKNYEFLCNIPLQADDIVVVDTQHGIQLARVTGVKKKSATAIRWIIQRVDLAEHEARLKAEETRKELEQQMAKRAAEYQKLNVYREMAKNDPQMAQLLQQYEMTGAQLLAWDMPSRKLTPGYDTKGLNDET